MGSLQAESSKDDLLQSQSHLWNHTFCFVNSMALKCAIELGIPDAIHSHVSPITLSQLAAALSLPPSKTPHLGRLLRLLVHSKFFSCTKNRNSNNNNREGDNEQEEDEFSLTSFSEVLVKEKRTDLSQFVLLMLDQMLLLPWHSLSRWFKQDEPSTAFEVAHGKGVWTVTGEAGEFNRMLNEGMSSDASFTTEVLVRDCGEIFKGLQSLVDVGGGTGTLALAIAKVFPKVKCTVLDLPHVVEGLEEKCGRVVRFVGGDMFESIPNADVVLFKWVLHDWSDEECVKILKRSKEAIPCKEEGGKVIIIDMVVKTNNLLLHEMVKTQFTFDIHMMVHTTGKQRTEHEWKKIFFAAGFRGYKILPLLCLRSVIEVYR